MNQAIIIINLKKNKKKGNYYLNIKPYCEPHLSKLNLQKTIGSQRLAESNVRAIKWLLSYSDGLNNIESISKKSGINEYKLKNIAITCCKKKILKKI